MAKWGEAFSKQIFDTSGYLQPSTRSVDRVAFLTNRTMHELGGAEWAASVVSGPSTPISNGFGEWGKDGTALCALGFWEAGHAIAVTTVSTAQC